jgi:GMP synthase (glutamine-hydrolysing)
MNSVLIIDFGSQVTELIARRVRELSVFSIVKNCDITLEDIKKISPKAIIFSGGPNSVNENFSPEIDKKIFDLNIPILGICYGQQLIAKLLGGKVEPADDREFGKAMINIKSNSDLFANFSSKENQVWMSHGDVMTKIPDNFEIIATTNNAPFAAIKCNKRKIYGVQFHPEVSHSLGGQKLISNFILNIAGCKQDWNMGNFMNEQIAKIKEEVCNEKVICGLSGGVDSSVVAALIHKAVGNNLVCIFVDHGLLRKDEGKEVKAVFEDHFKINLVYVDAKDVFLKNLEGISDPEKKRKIIGKTFIDIFDEESIKINAKFLAQGTLYPDIIESSHPNSGNSKTIKSHHNVGGLPEDMKLKLIEPVKTLFKDEVRKLGKELGLPDKIIKRHPFPGPGLAIRILGEISEEKINILQKADAIYITELKNNNLYDEIWQAFCVLLPVRTVGVMGDERTYEYVLSIRAVTSVDGMTADIYHFDTKFLADLSGKIISQVRGVNRVTYDITSKPPGTIEWE